MEVLLSNFAAKSV